MSMEWYDIIAKKNGGYKNNATYKVEGVSGESIFEKQLIELIKESKIVLDAGCGHGEFTLKISKYSRKIIGFDNSIELIRLANELLIDSQVCNLEFVLAGTNDKDGLPFKDESFDLIYTRRGPTSIIRNCHLLKPGGIMLGIHSAAKDMVEERLAESELIDIDIVVYDEAMLVFSNEKELEKYISSSHGSLDYSLAENNEALLKIVDEFTIDGEIKMQEWRYIWRGRKASK